ncbi:hypothetical protein D3C81_1797410 [compost metagenome]
MPDALHHQRADQHRQGSRSEQPPADLQAGRRQVQRHIVRPGRGLQRVQAFVEQHHAEQRENQHPHQQLPIAATGAEQPPQQHVEKNQGQGADQRMISKKGQHRTTPAKPMP